MKINRVMKQCFTLFFVTTALTIGVGSREQSEEQPAERSQSRKTKLNPEISYDSMWNVSVRTHVLTWAVSPDLKYAVRQTSQFAEVYDDDIDYPRSRTGLYEIVDLHGLSFRLIDTLPTYSESFVFCGPGMLMYTACHQEPTLPDSLLSLSPGVVYVPPLRLENPRVMLYDFLGGETPVKLAAADDNDSLNSWIQSTFWHYDFRLQDSLLVHDHAAGTDRYGRESDMQVLIRRLDSEGQFPIIRVIDGAEWPRFSADGKQVLAYRWIDDGSVLFRSSVVVYDFETDSVTQPDLPLRFCWRAQRLSKSGPIFYLGTDSAEKGYHDNLHRYDPETGTDTALTNLLPPASISLYQVSPDSIVYQVEKSTGSGVESWWETIRIAD